MQAVVRCPLIFIACSLLPGDLASWLLACDRPLYLHVSLHCHCSVCLPYIDGPPIIKARSSGSTSAETAVAQRLLRAPEHSYACDGRKDVIAGAKAPDMDI